MERLRTAKEAGPWRLPRDHGHLEMVEASYSHLREFAQAGWQQSTSKVAPQLSRCWRRQRC